MRGYDSSHHIQSRYLRTIQLLSILLILALFSFIVSIWILSITYQNIRKIKTKLIKIVAIVVTATSTTIHDTATTVFSFANAFRFDQCCVPSLNSLSLRQQSSVFHHSHYRIIFLGQIQENEPRHKKNKKQKPSLLDLSRITMKAFKKTTSLSLSSSDNAVTMGTEASNLSVNSKLFWNREYGSKADPCDVSLPIVRHAKIICLSNPNDINNQPLYDNSLLPSGCEVIHIGCHDINYEKICSEGGNVIFVSDGMRAKEPLRKLIEVLREQLIWIHSRSAGIDAFYNEALSSSFSGIITNSKGQFSSTLAEYTIASCLYFAKDFPRLLQQKQNQSWLPYPILELRGATLGIIGFGDIGQAAGRLAYAMGMNIITLTRQPRDDKDEFIHSIFSTDFRRNRNTIKVYDTTTTPDALNVIFQESDYVLLATPLTKETYKLIGMEQFMNAKEDCVLINVGRGPVIDEDALIAALQSPSGESCNTRTKSLLKGAALDVTAIEPLPQDSMLWKLPNVLLSPHNMDMTTTFMLESTEFFIQEQLPRFVRGLPLLNPVDVKVGY